MGYWLLTVRRRYQDYRYISYYQVYNGFDYDGTNSIW